MTNIAQHGGQDATQFSKFSLFEESVYHYIFKKGFHEVEFKDSQMRERYKC